MNEVSSDYEQRSAGQLLRITIALPCLLLANGEAVYHTVLERIISASVWAIHVLRQNDKYEQNMCHRFNDCVYVCVCLSATLSNAARSGFLKSLYESERHL